jgi:hypothetical protein
MECGLFVGQRVSFAYLTRKAMMNRASSRSPAGGEGGNAVGGDRWIWGEFS